MVGCLIVCFGFCYDRLQLLNVGSGVGLAADRLCSVGFRGCRFVVCVLIVLLLYIDVPIET